MGKTRLETLNDSLQELSFSTQPGHIRRVIREEKLFDYAQEFAAEADRLDAEVEQMKSSERLKSITLNNIRVTEVEGDNG